jgi:CheY-like chemotaxis protein
MAAPSPSKSAPRRRTFLYVDNDEAAIAVAREVLAQRDLVLVTAADAERAVTLARRTRPEVMLINVDLAAAGAPGLLRLLDANPETQAVPVLALGRDAAPQAAVNALEAGFFHYLVSPLDARHLAAALDYALEFSALERTEL